MWNPFKRRKAPDAQSDARTTLMIRLIAAQEENARTLQNLLAEVRTLKTQGAAEAAAAYRACLDRISEMKAAFEGHPDVARAFRAYSASEERARATSGFLTPFPENANLDAAKLTNSSGKAWPPEGHTESVSW